MQKDDWIDEDRPLRTFVIYPFYYHAYNRLSSYHDGGMSGPNRIPCNEVDRYADRLIAKGLMTDDYAETFACIIEEMDRQVLDYLRKEIKRKES